MRNSHKTIINSLFALALSLPLFASAATCSGFGNGNSTCSFSMNVTVPPTVYIGNLTNLVMSYDDTSYTPSATSAFCVSSNTPGQQYYITISSQHATGATFKMPNVSALPGAANNYFIYSLYFYNNPDGGAGPGGTVVSSGARLGPFGNGTPGGGGTVADCSLLGANNASLAFNFSNSTGDSPMAAGSYQDTLTLLVSAA